MAGCAAGEARAIGLALRTIVGRLCPPDRWDALYAKFFSDATSRIPLHVVKAGRAARSAAGTAHCVARSCGVGRKFAGSNARQSRCNGVAEAIGRCIGAPL
ncbi:hypothetical protein A8D95_27000 [Burkholderia cenocepacia]|uniref:Uncharacterized protein n=1 Tax=Burkholderia cenocepacia TaxID=95486 RepID=A0A1V2WAC6_9BURK|nr:hypothetical protein A8D83_30200 [Burkholderia cenocepacia]ONJ22133.1 hypothetical protein A8D90_25060 [Burkholderia cenocepacia]ONP27361.1 hypothetical protein A8D85_38140 [Burkholderia cenocepacia]ONP32029.1 hypothetical protein A8D84_09530 [Burkholderia cenocepacia]ONP38270.1 hypothetical protein A8D87_36850 [Burkholderia cenocepacia]